VGDLYLTWLADDLEAAGLQVVRYAGWTTRARRSGGYADTPLCVMWHHTASSTTASNDAYYMCHTSASRPICNVLVARSGEVWVLAAGATNTNGSGRSLAFSQGMVPTNRMNEWAVGMELANNGVGQPYPQVQIDAAFTVSNRVNQRLGGKPTDVATHAHYAPDRKIDPAMATAVQGSWQPRGINRNGTWNLEDLRNECARRSPPPPMPGPTPEGDEVFVGYWMLKNGNGAVYALYSNGTKLWMKDPPMLSNHQLLTTLNGGNTKINVQDSPDMFRAFGPIVGPIPPGVDAWGV
jgi:hypothetical protein